MTVDIPELGPKTQGKVRDIYKVDGRLIIITTDRQSAYDRMICTVPQKGMVLNLFSAFWFNRTRDIAPNHFIESPQPNVMITMECEPLEVEMVARRHITGTTTTSIGYQYFEQGKREIYGYKFPDGLRMNECLPDSMGLIITPTTKARAGSHDVPLTEKEAAEIVGKARYELMRIYTIGLFEFAEKVCLTSDLIIHDTKIEFGIDRNGFLRVIDELFTPDSSRFWGRAGYEERFQAGLQPVTFDKDILRRWLADQGFRGDGPVPTVDPEIILAMQQAYVAPYEMITGQKLPDSKLSDPSIIRQAVLANSGY
ncbi:hypothetical protein A2Z23_01915 [Candidatus Curtissbacteria bacterium RBG_16_39_7]|uniref:phosphoribosylaminoimidazolesuccinocarboxamide synthase n=1 Tax=Candidatus Curtissbacteria bacterium RBG_16_39_7 TaxID=1797707 RepID=A0A1F5G454_9BACT|nr:MAG: hypothetical protein A2Z23_01915 [Candidatus Curtissbacteria bacterium RBG_16_39_7]